ncbi:hypothetical protein [Polaribacter atrinae]|jgi:hypothetical protein|uniref:Uncharacterized protein n=1 Tax=Polaribacter atrinae TaxID=1333662 RepID=A0A176T3N1_9FLAO|nr:hypothetical protein [Polaribacter atrinae]OAD42380.1 hypothetical protein LPB303_14880 [Polaribacter atrinae]
MSGIDFNKCSISMGKVLKMLEEVTPKIRTSYDLEENKEEILIIAYVCRVGIIDRIEKYPSWMKNDLPIRIPKGLFRYKKVNMTEAFEMTIGNLMKLTEKNKEIFDITENVLRRGKGFYQFETILPFNFKKEHN